MRRLILVTSSLAISVMAFVLLTTHAMGLTISPNLTTTNDNTSSSSDIVVQQSPKTSLTQDVVSRAKSSWPWYITRASGLTAAVLLGILVLSGIGQVTGYTFKFLEPLTAWATHRALGLAFGVAVLIHMAALLFDHFVPFNIFQILVPFVSTYKPVSIWGVHFGTLYIALGVLAFYLIAIIIITSLLWVDKKPYTWKLLHLLTYLVILFVFIHALYIGTDLAHGILRWLWILGGIILLAAAVYRLWRAKTI